MCLRGNVWLAVAIIEAVIVHDVRRRFARRRILGGNIAVHVGQRRPASIDAEVKRSRPASIDAIDRAERFDEPPLHDARDQHFVMFAKRNAERVDNGRFGGAKTSEANVAEAKPREWVDLQVFGDTHAPHHTK